MYLFDSFCDPFTFFHSSHYSHEHSENSQSGFVFLSLLGKKPRTKEECCMLFWPGVSRLSIDHWLLLKRNLVGPVFWFGFFLLFVFLDYALDLAFFRQRMPVFLLFFSLLAEEHNVNTMCLDGSPWLCDFGGSAEVERPAHLQHQAAVHVRVLFFLVLGERFVNPVLFRFTLKEVEQFVLPGAAKALTPFLAKQQWRPFQGNNFFSPLSKQPSNAGLSRCSFCWS